MVDAAPRLQPPGAVTVMDEHAVVLSRRFPGDSQDRFRLHGDGGYYIADGTNDPLDGPLTSVTANGFFTSEDLVVEGSITGNHTGAGDFTSVETQTLEVTALSAATFAGGLAVTGSISAAAVAVTGATVDTLTSSGGVFIATIPLTFTEVAGAPSAPAANKVVVYAIDNGGKTELLARFPTGSAVRLAIEP